MGSSTAYDESEARVYDERRFSTPGGREIHRVEMSMVHAALGRVPARGRFLEVGCGTARIMGELVGQGYHVTGLDASLPMLRRASTRPGVEGAVAAGDATSLPFDRDTFDLVYSIRVLNQLGTRATALAVVDELVRVAKPGGVVLVEFESAARPRIPTRRYKGVRLSPEEVADRVRAAGGEVDDVRGAFVLGMTAYRAVPGVAVGAVRLADTLASLAMPTRGSRCYLFAHKVR